MSTDQDVIKKVNQAGKLSQYRGTSKPKYAKSKPEKGKHLTAQQAAAELFSRAEKIIRTYTSGSAKIDDAAARLFHLLSTTGKGVSLNQIYFNMVDRAPMTYKERQAAYRELLTGRDNIYNRWEHLGAGHAISAEDIERMKKLKEKYDAEAKKAKQKAAEKPMSDNLKSKRKNESFLQKVFTGLRYDSTAARYSKGKKGR